MREQWQQYADKFAALSQREQYMIFITGLFAIVFGIYSLVVEQMFIDIKQTKSKQQQMMSANKTLKSAITALQAKLENDPNALIKVQNALYKKKLGRVNDELTQLTSELIDPVEMRDALIKLLKVDGVSLLSFQLLGAESLDIPETLSSSEQPPLNGVKASDEGKISLYRHGIKIKLKGNYFQLLDYLLHLELLKWKFYWRELHYQTLEYPLAELEIEIYSLSTHEEFIGV